MTNTKFVTDLNSTYHSTEILEDNRYLFMLAVHNSSENNTPLYCGSAMLRQKFIESFDSAQDSKARSEVTTVNVSTPSNQGMTLSQMSEVTSMGAGSQVKSNLSQFRLDSEIEVIPAIPCNRNAEGPKNLSFFHQLNPSFMDLVQHIKTQEQADEAIDMFNKLRFKLSSNSLKKRTIESDATTFIGEINGSRKKEKRHKSFFEK